MIKLLLIKVLLIISLFFTAGAAEQEIVGLVRKTIASSQDPRGAEVWPGFDLAGAPVVAAFDNGHLYAFQLKSSNPMWKSVDGALYSENDPWGAARIAMHQSFPIENQSAYLFNFDRMSKDKEKAFEVFLHERFHTFQFTRFPKQTAQGRYVDHLNADNLTLMQYEERILAAFLDKQKPEILRDYLAVQQMRQALITPSSIAWENHQQSMEGLADYVSFRFFDVFSLFPNYSGQRKLAQQLKNYAGDPNISERALKWRHYGVGAALGYALDILQVKEWKQKIEKGDNLNSILGQTLAMTPEEILERFDYIAVACHFKEAQKYVHKVVAQFEKEINDLKDSYKKQSGIVVQIGHPAQTSISGGGMTGRTLYLEDGSTISLEDTSEMATPENKWMMQTRRVPYLFQTPEGLRELKVEEDVNLYIDGQTFSLKTLVQSKTTKSFSTLSFEGQSSRFFAESNPGTMAVLPDGKVRITFN